MTRGPYSLEAAVTSFLPESHDVAGRSGTGGTAWPLAAGLLLCDAIVARPSLNAGGCGGLEIQRMQVSGYGVTSPGSGSAAWSAPTLTAFLDPRLTSALWLTARLDAGVPLRRPTFGLDNVGTVFRVAPAFVRASVGIAIRF